MPKLSEQPNYKTRLYLATPYSGTTEEQDQRFLEACRLAGFLITKGYTIFSPIAHSKPIADACGLSHGHGFWSELNETWLRWASDLVVAKFPGWLESHRIRFEMAEALKRGKGIWTVEVLAQNIDDQRILEVRFARATGSSLS